MPPEGYTTVTITDETAELLDAYVEDHGFGSRDGAIAHALERARTSEEEFTDAELARMLADRLAD